MSEPATSVNDAPAPRRHPGLGLTVFLGVVTAGVFLFRFVQGAFIDLDCQKQLVTENREVLNIVMGTVLGAVPMVTGLVRGIVRRRWRWPWVVALGLHGWTAWAQFDFIRACPNW